MIGVLLLLALGVHQPAVARSEPPAGTAARSQETTAQGRPIVQVERLQDTDRLSVDGVLDEAVWKRAVPATDFKQQDPNNGEPATERTEVRVVFDENRIVLGVPASTPSRIACSAIRCSAISPLAATIASCGRSTRSWMAAPATSSRSTRWARWATGSSPAATRRRLRRRRQHGVGRHLDGARAAVGHRLDGRDRDSVQDAELRSDQPTRGASTFSGPCGARTKTACGPDGCATRVSRACRTPAVSPACATSRRASVSTSSRTSSDRSATRRCEAHRRSRAMRMSASTSSTTSRPRSRRISPSTPTSRKPRSTSGAPTSRASRCAFRRSVSSSSTARTIFEFPGGEVRPVLLAPHRPQRGQPAADSVRHAS